MVGIKMKLSEIPTKVIAWWSVAGIFAVIVVFFHDYVHADSDAILEQHLQDFNGLVRKIEISQQQRLIQNATSNINFIDEKLAEDNLSNKREAVLLRNRGYYVGLRECYRDPDSVVCE